MLALMPTHRDRAHADTMTDRNEFLAWVEGPLYAAELAVHNGDTAPRRALWSRTEPVSVLGGWHNAFGQREVDALFAVLAVSFSDCTSSAFELLAYDVVGDPGLPPGGRRMAGRPSPR